MNRSRLGARLRLRDHRRPRDLRVEPLEQRELLSINSADALSSKSAFLVSILAGSVNQAPTISRSIVVNNRAAINGTTSALSVLGNDDGGETNLRYTWSVVSRPSGGSATFSVNGTNDAKNTSVTFTKAGTYSFSVSIIDAQGRSTKTSATATVNSVYTSLDLFQGSARLTTSAECPLIVRTTNQALTARAYDQFGQLIASQPTISWSVTAKPGGVASPSLSGGSTTTATFSTAGAYQITARASVGRVTQTNVVNLAVVAQPTYLVTAGYSGSVTGTSMQFDVTGVQDQFRRAVSDLPTIDWAFSSIPAGATAPTLDYANGTLKADFSKAGSYTLTATMTAADGSTTRQNFSVNVAQTPTTISDTAMPDLATSGASVLLAKPTFTDQFGNTIAGGPSLNWTATTLPSAAATPTFSSSASGTTATFKAAGTYVITARATANPSLSFTTNVVVSQTYNRLVVTAGSQNSATAVSQQYTVLAVDQFGKALTDQPTLSATATALPSGAVAPTFTIAGNLLTATFSKAGSYTILARMTDAGNHQYTTSIAVSLTQKLTSVVTTTAFTTGGTSQTLGTPSFRDQFGNAMATTTAFTWAVTSVSAGATTPTLTTRGSTTTAAFKSVGTYVFKVKATSASSVAASVTVVVTPTATRITVSPGTATVAYNATKQFTATAIDQFSKQIASPALTWNATAGTIDANGLFIAPASGASATITAASGSVRGTATVTMNADPLALANQQLGALTQSLFADGSISRNDMIQILRSVANAGTLSASDLTDLRTIVANATRLNIADYVRVLAGDVVNGNAANAKYQGQTAGNLAAGSSSALFNNLINKWFLGTDHPTLTDSSYVYRSASGSLFAQTPSHADEKQGVLGDCYFISAMGTIADSNAQAVSNMFVDNGDGTYTVRFYAGTIGSSYVSSGVYTDTIANATADYVTVDKYLATSSSGYLVYSDYNSRYDNASNTLWLPLAEKAYAQWNETGKEGRDGKNAFSSIEGGWMANVDVQVLGHSVTDYYFSTTANKQALISAVNAHKAVTLGTTQSLYGLYGSHAYAVIGYNSANDTFTLYNPWGFSHPGALTWSQLQQACSVFSVADCSATTPIGGAPSGPTGFRATPSTAVAINLATALTMQSAAPSRGIELTLNDAAAPTALRLGGLAPTAAETRSTEWTSGERAFESAASELATLRASATSEFRAAQSVFDRLGRSLEGIGAAQGASRSSGLDGGESWRNVAAFDPLANSSVDEIFDRGELFHTDEHLLVAALG